MSIIGTLGMNAATQAIGQGIGLVAGGIQDKRQRKQQQALTDIQSEANKRQAEHSSKLAMDMWNNTNYGAQADKMREAGLNVGLMYGGSGAGGGTTAGAGQAGAVSGGSAGDPNAGVGMGMQMASQLALMKAQKENIEADTANKRAGEGKDIVTTEGQKIENRGKEVDVTNKETLKDELRDALLGEAKKKSVEGVVAEETQRDQIKMLKQNVVNQMLEAELQKGKINLTQAQIKEISEKLAQGWKGLEFQGVDKVTGKYIEQLADFMKKLVVGSGGN